MAKAETLVDDFTGSTIDTSKWNVVVGAPTQNGYLELATVSTYEVLASDATYDLTDSYALLEITQMPSGGTSDDANVFLEFGDLGAGDYIEIGVDSQVGGADLLTWGEYTGYVPDFFTTITLDATAHRWVRLRSAGGTSYGDTSPDGLTWTNRFSYPDRAFIAAGTIIIASGRVSGTPGTTRVDNLNNPPAWAGPTLIGTPATEAGTSHGASQAITMPSGIAAGELLIAAVSIDAASTLTTSSTGWVKLGGSNAAAVSGAVFAKVAAGSDTLTVDGGTTQDYAAIVWRVDDHGVTSPSTDITFASTTGTSSTPDPPNCNPGVSGDFLWIEGFSADDDDDTAAYPSTGFAPLGQLQSASSASSCLTSVAWRKYTGSALNPGTMAMAASEEWWAWTLAIPQFSSSVTGTAAVTLAAATSSASGSTVVGSSAQTLTAFTSTASGSTVTGTSAQTLAAATSSASGAHGVAGTSTTTNAAFTSTASGSTVTGSSAQTLAAATSAASGTHSISGTSAQTLADFTSAATGSFGADVTGTSATTNAAFTSTATGAHGVVGSSATTNAALTSSATGSTVTGTSATTNAAATSSASGAHGVAGTSATTNAAFTSSATGAFGLDPTGTVAATLASFTGAATGSSVVGSSAATNAAATSTATGAVGAAGTAAATLAAYTSAASGTFTGAVSGTVASTLADFLAAAGGSSTSGALAQTLAAFTSTATGTAQGLVVIGESTYTAHGTLRRVSVSGSGKRARPLGTDERHQLIGTD